MTQSSLGHDARQQLTGRFIDEGSAEKRREQEIRSMLTKLFDRFADRLTDHRVVLFGSRAQGCARPRSDFDLAVVGNEPIPLKDFFAIADALEDLPTLYRIDWVDLARASERFRTAALEHFEVIYEP